MIERRLEWPRIDMGEQVALLDQLALLEGDPVDLTVNAGADYDGIETLNGPEPGEIDRKIVFPHGGDLDRNRARLRGGVIGAVMLSRAVLPKRVATRQRDHRDEGSPTENSRP
jgi:hypothetical protein